MNKTFIGKRSENNKIIDSLRAKITNIFSVKDKAGLKIKNVYFVEIDENKNETWKQILPSPRIRDYDSHQRMTEGGVTSTNDITMTGIPINKYTQEDLSTSRASGDKNRFYVIEGNAYIVTLITQKLLTWEVTLKRYESYNKGTLQVP